METYFKNERLRLNIKQAELAEKCEVALRTITNWETGINPIPSDKLAILASLGFDIQYLITGKYCNTKTTAINSVTKEQLIDTLEILLRAATEQEINAKASIKEVTKAIKSLKE